MKKISLNSLNFRLDRNDMRMIFGGKVAIDGDFGCIKCKVNSDCGSTVCATDRPNCPGRACL